MSRIIQIEGKLPPTLNEQINDARTHYRISAAKKRKWTNYICAIAKRHKPFDFSDLIWIEYHWFVKTFARDSDNVSASAKFINDGIVAAGLIKNDNLTVIQSPVIHYYYRSKEDRFLVKVANNFELLAKEV